MEDDLLKEAFESAPRASVMPLGVAPFKRKRLAGRSGAVSGNGPSRHFAVTQQFARFRSEADISEPFAESDL